MGEKTLQEIARWKGISIDRYILYIAIESYTDNDEKLMTWNISHPVCSIVSQSAGPLFSPHSCCQNRLEQNLRGIQDPMQCLASISSRGGQLVKLWVDKKCSTFPPVLQ